MLHITNWDENFENNRTRELKSLMWVPIPNKMDGDGYTELLAHKNGAAHFGVWIALVQIASKCQPRGQLVRASGLAHDSASLARITRIPKRTINAAIPRLIAIGWLSDSTSAISQDGARISQEPVPEWKGMEGNGREEKRRERAKFSPPTPEEVQAYCEEKGYDSVDPARFVAFYESKNWMVGKNKMARWKAAVAGWHARNMEENKKTKDIGEWFSELEV